MARTTYSIKGTLFLSTSNTEKTQGEINNEIRSIAGVVTLNTRHLDKDKIAAVVKVDPYPYGGKFTQEVHDKVIAEIIEIPGVRKFNVSESPFIKPEPKAVFNPTPTKQTSYDTKQGNNQSPRSIIPSRSQNSRPQGN
jgi:hypothetical protein